MTTVVAWFGRGFKAKHRVNQVDRISKAHRLLELIEDDIFPEKDREDGGPTGYG